MNDENNHNKYISVALCTYNGENFIREQLESILSQTIVPDEIIICDDGSTDETIRIANDILSCSNLSYQIISNKKNKGVVKNFQHALQLCKGDILFLCDQDDYWKPNKVERIIEEFKKDNCMLVFTNADIVDKNRKILNEFTLWQNVGFAKRLLSMKESGLNLLLRYCVATGATMAVTRKLIEICIPFPEEWIHDGWLMINAYIRNGVVAIDENLIEYRQHDNNVIGVKTNENRNVPLLKMKHAYNRDIWLRRYSMFYSRNKDVLNPKMKRQTLACISFWNDIYSIEQKKAKNWLLLLSKNVFNKNFFIYANGWDTVKYEIKVRIKLLFQYNCRESNNK